MEIFNDNLLNKFIMVGRFASEFCYGAWYAPEIGGKHEGYKYNKYTTKKRI
jgi:hypothetical protein